MAEAQAALGDVDAAVDHAADARSLSAAKGTVPGVAAAQQVLDLLGG